MSRRHELKRRLGTLGEIKNIMESMRLLSLLETKKLTRFIDCQSRVVRTQRDAAADFLAFHPLHRSSGPIAREAFLAIGSERGFCGDFNTTVRERLSDLLPRGKDSRVIAVGRKLAGDLEALAPSLQLVEGPSTAEEVPAVLQRLLPVLDALVEAPENMRLTVVHHGGAGGNVVATILIPAFDDVPKPMRRYSSAPQLYLSPEAFYAGLVDHYLFAHLHQLAFTSLFYEHQRRVQHLDGATQRLEQMLEDLSHQNNALRQEEITEELEIIMLGADLVKTS